MEEIFTEVILTKNCNGIVQIAIHKACIKFSRAILIITRERWAENSPKSYYAPTQLTGEMRRPWWACHTQERSAVCTFTAYTLYPHMSTSQHFYTSKSLQFYGSTGQTLTETQRLSDGVDAKFWQNN